MSGIPSDHAGLAPTQDFPESTTHCAKNQYKQSFSQEEGLERKE